jgi:hypothetical protein
MDHVDYLLPDFVNGRLEEALKQGVESHLRECPRCRDVAESLQNTFTVLQASQPDSPTPSYFASILPRVRQRLEEQETIPFFSRPVFVRLLAPLAAGALAIVILLHLPIFQTGPEVAVNPLRSVVRGTTTEELAEAVLEHSRRQPLANGLSEGELSSLMAAHVLRGPIISGTLDAQNGGLVEPIFGTSITEAIEELSEEQLDLLLQRLGERTIL